MRHLVEEDPGVRKHCGDGIGEPRGRSGAVEAIEVVGHGEAAGHVRGGLRSARPSSQDAHSDHGRRRDRRSPIAIPGITACSWYAGAQQP